MSVTIAGLGSALPVRTVTNDELSRVVDTTHDWIFSRTGIAQRQVLTDERITDLAVAAARRALADAHCPADAVDLVLGSTTCSDYLLPSLASTVQEQLAQDGMQKTAYGFDLTAACTGFLAALDVAQAYIAAGKARCVLVVCAEALSQVTDWRDRSTCVLFGDAAAAAVLVPAKTATGGICALRLSAQPATAPLAIPAPRGNSPFATNVAPDAAADLNPTDPFIHMQGREVFKFATRAITSDIEAVLHQAGATTTDIRHYVLHQANQRIIDAAAARLGVDLRSFPGNIERYGNTASASVVLVLDELKRAGRLSGGDQIIISAFGAGLLSGAALIKWED